MIIKQFDICILSFPFFRSYYIHNRTIESKWDQRIELENILQFISIEVRRATFVLLFLLNMLYTRLLHIGLIFRNISYQYVHCFIPKHS